MKKLLHRTAGLIALLSATGFLMLCTTEFTFREAELILFGASTLAFVFAWVFLILSFKWKE